MTMGRTRGTTGRCREGYLLYAPGVSLNVGMLFGFAPLRTKHVILGVSRRDQKAFTSIATPRRAVE